MAKSRASVFGGGDEAPALDLASFAPKKSADLKAPPAAEVREVSLAAQFRSREPAAAKPQGNSKRAPRQHRTGRNVQLNVKAKQETIDDMYAITDAHPGWVLGYTLERALEALKRELKAQA